MRPVALGVAAVALIAAAGVLARGLAGPDPQALAVLDGCERNDTTLHTTQSPNWVHVYDSTTKATDAPPQQRWAHGTVSSNGLPWYSPHTSGGDTPNSHASYDVNMDVLPDAQDADLLGLANLAETKEEKGRLHVEREEGATPVFVWPEPGDRVMLKGYWVWDCDHFLPAGERTEIHPITALWVERKWSPHSATGEAEADLFLTTDKTEAGQHADCAHKTKHDQAAFKACVAGERNWVDMSGTYKFVLTLPPSPRGGAKVVRIADMGSVNRPRIRVATKGGDPNGAGIAFEVPRDGKRHVVALRVFAGWKYHKTRPQHLRVSVEKVLIRRAMDPACLPQKSPPCGTPETTHEDQVSKGPIGEWNFYWSVGGVWSLWKPAVFRVRDGQTFRPEQSVDIYVPRGRSWRVFVWTRECDWGTLALGGSGALAPCPKQPEVGNRSGEDVPGGALATFRGAVSGVRTLKPVWGIGSCPQTVNPKGCYAVTIRVRRIR